VVKKADAIITVSQDLENGMKNLSLNNRHYYRVFNSVNTNVFHLRNKEAQSFFNLLHVSEFKNEHKNIKGLLHAIKILSTEISDIRLHLVGYGNDLENILSYIEQLELNNLVIYHGKLHEQELSHLYNLADVFVLFSNKENMPCVIAESLSSGTPVISTDVGGINEVINESNGILIPVGNEEQLVVAIKKMMSEYPNYDHNKIAKASEILFSEQAVGLEQFSIYKQVLASVSGG
jgi:glycosyltransferase involved in cell wall biosynthesis